MLWISVETVIRSSESWHEVNPRVLRAVVCSSRPSTKVQCAVRHWEFSTVLRANHGHYGAEGEVVLEGRDLEQHVGHGTLHRYQVNSHSHHSVLIVAEREREFPRRQVIRSTANPPRDVKQIAGC